MITVFINQPELLALESLRIALSEPTMEEKLAAIECFKFDIVGHRYALLSSEFGSDWVSEPANEELVRWFSSIASRQQDAVEEFVQIKARYENTNEFKLNVAEEIADRILKTISAGRFQGVQTDDGLLYQVRQDAKTEGIRGAKGKETVPKIWKAYRGVVHLGLALSYCENFPEKNLCPLIVAEEMRKVLSNFCPKGTKKPYINANDQIKFVYISMTSSPRFRNRGLPFYVS